MSSHTTSMRDAGYDDGKSNKTPRVRHDAWYMSGYYAGLRDREGYVTEDPRRLDGR